MVAAEGPDKTVWQVALNQSEPEGPQELPGNPSWRSEQGPHNLSPTQEAWTPGEALR